MIKFQKFLDFFLVEECLNCRKSGELICENCLLKIKNQKINLVSEAKNLDFRNTQYIRNITWVDSVLLYQNQTLRKALFALKYNYVEKVTKYLAKISYVRFFRFLRENYPTIFKEQKNLILIPIPISKKRKIKRNYNQSEILLLELIKSIQEKIKINLANNLYLDLLLKVKETIRFSETHNQDKRVELIQGAFTVNIKYNAEFLQDKIIILFDDITTTGATFCEARRTLVKAGANQESIFAFAIAH